MLGKGCWLQSTSVYMKMNSVRLSRVELLFLIIFICALFVISHVKAICH
jgi:hypothetical protein